MQKVNVQNKLACFTEHWSPKVIAELNGQQVKVAKLSGKFDWHFHEQEDELFWVIEGYLEIHLRDKVIELHPGELCVVPVAIHVVLDLMRDIITDRFKAEISAAKYGLG